MWRLSVLILSVWVQVLSVSTSVVYFTDRARCKSVLPFRHCQTPDVDFCCHTVCSSGPIYALQLPASVIQTDSCGPSMELWRCHMKASAQSALRTSGVSHSCVCGCFIVSDYKIGFSLSLSKTEINFHMYMSNRAFITQGRVPSRAVTMTSLPSVTLTRMRAH
jgi:hypothetical protein